MLSAEEVQECERLMKKLEPGFLPTEVFSEVARVTRIPVVVIVPVRYNAAGTKEIGTLKRDEKERFWPGIWHLPGSVFRSTDTWETIFERILQSEIKAKRSEAPRFREAVMHQTERGAEMVLLHTVEGLETDAVSHFRWVEANALPEPFLESERRLLERLPELNLQ